MGNITTIGWANAVAQEEVSLRSAVGAHLSGNFYPALPGEYVDPLLKAIDNVVADDPKVRIVLPGDINPAPREAEYNEDRHEWTIGSGELVDICRAWPFVDALLGEDYE